MVRLFFVLVLFRVKPNFHLNLELDVLMVEIKREIYEQGSMGRKRIKP